MLLNRIWAWLTKVVPEETEEVLREEQVVLEARLAEIETLIAAGNVQRLLAHIAAARARMHAARATPPNQRELDIIDKWLAKKKDCNHLKGGTMRPINDDVSLWDKFRGGTSMSKDYNIGVHRYLDGHTEIKCLTCGEVWTKDSPDWKEAVKMSKLSSNKASASETTAEDLVRNR